MLIYKKLIENYIQKTLSIDSIKEYSEKENIILSDAETIIIYNFIKRNYKSILNQDESSFQELKQKLSPEIYHELYRHYTYYKNKFF